MRLCITSSFEVGLEASPGSTGAITKRSHELTRSNAPPYPGATGSATGLDAYCVADRTLDRFGHGDIYLVVPPDQWSHANEMVENVTDWPLACGGAGQG
jgi:hypothetical protein